MPDAAGSPLACQCCIVGGGPAGMMLGMLLGRAGVRVIVLEKHADFLRDFRGDTIHPSTLEVMHELGLLDRFLALPHQRVSKLIVNVSDREVVVADFRRVPTRCKFVAFMPQWDFLDFVADEARRYPTFELKMRAKVVDLVMKDGRVAGVRASTPSGPIEVLADLVVAADGRDSVVREKAGLEVLDLGAPMDLLWMRLSKRPSDPQNFGTLDAGAILVTLDRGDYWQCAYAIPKGAFAEIRAAGVPAFRARIARLAAFLRDRVDELRDWDEVKLLTVRVDRLRRWYRPGLLCIGDAAHAMSPIGGVGINIAIQDAVAAANLLAKPLRERSVDESHLRAIQRRRALPARLTQRVQILVQNRVVGKVLGANNARLRTPLPFRLLRRWPWLNRMPARIVGVGFRPEHVHPSLRT